ncbi:hypothetical protein CLOSTASPAR_02434 [[Clostridium] asparagiforme DSM 15981]|uniref:Uncharacterized protein n=1 Tax=[Clostridium] asparagiforme DSM 15981 TaxID=518636 RepID=C0CZK7_9FIRM|nr:hypothetical protein CLOSTASPAR_02434 [[Clostridium] asparagiforme DSM 15981]
MNGTLKISKDEQTGVGQPQPGLRLLFCSIIPKKKDNKQMKTILND